ncbi:Hydroxyproline dehydrogenase [Amphibalanus amphitrite]|uniref:Proline dehydrogenase n=1 Tax=Amphibalanus amphitrite TaxID=1232801 RepID=A0A6A4WDV0_AMPAM|nr:Hydroxyproline dehydrogenase [Amphibalanus amphitrite]
MLLGVRSSARHGRPARHLRLLQAAAAQLEPDSELDFSDPRQVFDKKSTPELVRSLAVLKLCSQDWFVDNALPILRGSERLLGRRLLLALARPLYSQFVPGTCEADLAQAAARLRRTGVRLVFAHMLEDDLREGQTLSALLDDNLALTLHQFGMATRVTAGEDTPLHPAQADRSGEFCERHGLRTMVDGEYSYTNPAIGLLTLALAANFNTQSPLIWGTTQCYLRDAEQTLTKHLSMVDSLGVSYGVKLVRGAYLEKEVTRALKLGIPRPIHDTYQATSDMYNSQVERMLGRVAALGDRSAVMVASHNENSVRLAVRLMAQLGLPRDDGRVLFGQTYGVYEQVSTPLASAGYAVYKSTPLGDISSILPYLARRAAENRTVARGTRSERRLLAAELCRRLGLTGS